MTVLRNILQRCARKASILSGTPSQIQCTSTFNPVYMDPTCILRQAYSSDANETPKNAKDSVQKYILEMMNSKKSPLQDQNASKTPTVNQNLILQKSPLGQTTKSQPGVAEDQNALKTPTFTKNLNLRKYYINVRHLSKETTPETLREFYSQFGEIASCNIIFQGDRNQFGSIAFLNEEAVSTFIFVL
ncbi:RNA recognition motif domain-containing protein [Ditylenchus destructor]|nr:RNA recognition motif domain-containing protein [Ditylenchus destructor]